MAEVGTVTSSAADSLDEAKRRREEEKQARKAQEAQFKDETKSPSQKSSEEKQSERAQAQQRQNNKPFRAETRAQSQASPQERLKAAVPGYKDDQSPETQEKNAELLLKRLSDQIEESKEKMGAERDEYPGAPTGLSTQQQVATAQIATEQRQIREEKLTEAQRQAVEQKETIYDLAKKLMDRGLHKEASEILGRHVLGQEANKTITELQDKIQEDQKEAISTATTGLEKSISNSQEQIANSDSQIDRLQKKLQGSTAKYQANLKAEESFSKYRGRKPSSAMTAHSQRQREIKEYEAKQQELERLVQTRQSQLYSQAQQERRLAEAKRLEAQGDLNGAEKVLAGESYSANEALNIDVIYRTENENTESSSLPQEEREALSYRDVVTEVTQQSLANLKTLRQGVDAQAAALKNPQLSKAQRDVLTQAYLENQKALDDQARQADQLLQYQAHLTDLVDQGKFDEVNALRERMENGEAAFDIATQNYNNPQEVYRLERQGIKSTNKEAEEQYHKLRETASETQRILIRASNTLAKNVDSDASFLTGMSTFELGSTAMADALGDFEIDITKDLDTQQHYAELSSRAVDSISRAKEEARGLYEQGKYREANEVLGKVVKFGNQELKDSYGKISKHYRDQAGELERNLDSALETGRTVGVMVTAAAVTIGTGGAGAPVGYALVAGTAAGTAFGFTAKLGIGYTDDTKSHSEIWADAAKGIPRDALTAFESSLAVATGGAAAGASKSLLTKALSATSKRFLSSMAAGAGSTAPGIVHDSAESMFRRAEIISSMQGKSQAEIDARLKEEGLDTQSIITRNAYALLSGSASGLAGGVGDDMAALMRTPAGRAAVRTAEELTNIGFASAELMAQGIDPRSEEFSQMILQNVAQASASKTTAQVQIGARHTDADASTNRNEQAQSIKNQELRVRSSADLPPDVLGKTTVTVAPDGTRTVEVEIRPNTEYRAEAGDAKAEKVILEEKEGHARENPIDPLVKQADGSYKPMSQDQYMALRAKQELVQRSKAEGKYAQQEGQDLSEAKKDLKETILAVEREIKAGNYQSALDIAARKGVGETYHMLFRQDYEQNTQRDPSTDALEQTSYATDSAVETAKADNLQVSKDETRAKALLQEIKTLEELQREGPRLLAEANGNAQKIQQLIKARETEIYHSLIDGVSQVDGFPGAAKDSLANLRKVEDSETRQKVIEALKIDDQAKMVQQLKQIQNQTSTTKKSRKKQKIHPEYTENPAQFKSDFLESVTKKQDLEAEYSKTIQDLQKLDPNSEEFTSKRAQLQEIDAQLSNTENYINDRRQTFMSQYPKDNPFKTGDETSKQPTSIDEAITMRENEIREKAYLKLRGQLKKLKNLSNAEIQSLINNQLGKEVAQKTDPSHIKLDPKLRDLYAQQDLAIKTSRYRTDISEMKRIVDSIGERNNLSEIDRVKLHAALNNIKNSKHHPELAQQFIKDIEQLQSIEGVEELIQHTNNSLNNENGDNYGPARGNFSTARRAVVLLEQGIDIAGLEVEKLNSPIIDQNGNNLLNGVQSDDINTRREKLLKQGIITETTNGQGHYRLNHNGENFYVDLKNLKVYNSNGVERNIVYDRQRELFKAIPDADILASGKFKDSNGKTTFEGTAMIENKLNYLIHTTKNERLLSESNAETQLSTHLKTAKANGIGMIGLMGNFEHIRQPDGSIDQNHDTLNQFRAIIQEASKQFPESEGYPQIRILDEKGIDITEEIGLR